MMTPSKPRGKIRTFARYLTWKAAAERRLARQHTQALRLDSAGTPKDLSEWVRKNGKYIPTDRVDFRAVIEDQQHIIDDVWVRGVPQDFHETFHLDMTHLSLRRHNFSGMNFGSSVSFASSDCSAVTFDRVNIDGGCFNDTVLDGAKFYGAALKNVTFVGAYACRAIFERAALTNVNCMHANFYEARFRKATLNLVKFSDCELNSVTFSRAILLSVQFDDAKRLSGALFTGAVLEKVSFNGVSSFSSIDFSGSKMSEVDFRGANLERTIGLELAGTLIDQNTRLPDDWDREITRMNLPEVTGAYGASIPNFSEKWDILVAAHSRGAESFIGAPLPQGPRTQGLGISPAQLLLPRAVLTQAQGH